MKSQLPFTTLLILATHKASAYDNIFDFTPSTAITEESASLDSLYQAALGSSSTTITLWHGGDEPTSSDALKQSFEQKFPGLTLNVTVDLSKYHDVNIDRQLATNSLFVDVACLQTLNDYPRWKEENALLNYKPAGWGQVDPGFKDIDGAYYGYVVINWALLSNTNKTSNAPTDYADFLKEEFKNKIVLTYPNDDDAVLYQFDLILKHYGLAWFESLLNQNPKWVRGTATPKTLLSQPNTTYATTFTSSTGHADSAPVIHHLPTNGTFTTWPQTCAIFKDAPNTPGAKLLVNYLLSTEFQENNGLWSVRGDVESGGVDGSLRNATRTNAAEFARWMADRARVERLRFFFESRLGTAQGESPLTDGI